MTNELNGRVVVVTGTTAGIGKATAEGLAASGATLICVNRDQARGEAALAELRAKVPGAKAELMLCDLASQASIHAFAGAFRARFDRLHVLVNNVGVINQTRLQTVDGHEHTFGLNHLGPFLLTNLLLDLLRASAPARIINLSSDAHRAGHLDFDDLMFERRRYTAFAAYGQSKLANIAFTYELARRLEGTGVTVNAVHPGGVSTNFGSGSTGLMGIGMKIFRALAISPEKGAATSVHLATHPQGAELTGRYWVRKRVVSSNRESRDPEVWRKLWEVSERLTGLKAGAPRAA